LETGDTGNAAGARGDVGIHPRQSLVAVGGAPLTCPYSLGAHFAYFAKWVGYLNSQ